MIHELIEELRLKMQEIASDKDLTDPSVVSVSERLDILINTHLLAQKQLAAGGNDHITFTQQNTQ